MKFMKAALIAVLVLFILSACSSKGSVEGEDAGGSLAAGGRTGGPKINKYGRGADGGMYGSGAGGAGGGGRYGAGGSGDPELDNPSGPLSKRVVYFQYDSYEVLPEYQSVVSAHASYLASHPERNAVLEGHADERGSPEYNIALGEQRAMAVARMMELQGVAESQVQVVSFGEEKPADSGHDETAWQHNRRVEISYPGH